MSIKSITAEELAVILYVSHWRTIIDVAGDSYVVALCEFSRGTFSRSIVIREVCSCENRYSLPSDHDVTIMIREAEDEDHASILWGRFGRTTRINKVKKNGRSTTTTTTVSLPPTVGFGDFPLLGEPLDDCAHPNDIRSYASGFLLRVRRN